MRVTCFGSGKNTPEDLYNEMKKVGELLARGGVEIATGAFGGIGMQAAPEGSRNGAIPITVTGYTYGGHRPNPYITHVVDCLALAGDIPFDSDYCVRLAGLLSSDAFIVAGGGGPGTFLELAATINFNEKFWIPMKRVAILETRREAGHFWNHAMVAALRDWGVLSAKVAETIRIAGSAEEAVGWSCHGIEPT